MCGIVGLASHRKNINPLTADKKSEILKSIHHRGPDMFGEYEEEDVWFGHVRLSILDLTDAGRQPMQSVNGRYIICYNGEVYNHIDITHTLGLTNLRSHSDTEVILNAFEKTGVKIFEQFNGMFAFSIYDKYERKIWLVRDHLGIKPLYYHIDENCLKFSSEIKAIRVIDNNFCSINYNAIHEWLYFGNTLGDQTLYLGIQKLLPGHYLEFDLNSFTYKIECYWNPSCYTSNVKADYSVKERIHQTRILLEQAVRRQLISDVPVGIFLSGGIDSSAITAFASQHYNGKIATYSVDFDYDKGNNELPLAKEVAKLFNTDHHELHISGFEILNVIEKMIHHHDMPFSDAANIPLYLLSSMVNNSTKVILQGDGGDEMFGGYSRYSTLSFYNIVHHVLKIGNLINDLSPKDHKYHRRRRYINAFRSNDIAEVMALLLTQEDRNTDPPGIFSPAVKKLIIQKDPFIRYKECQAVFKNKDILSQMFLIDSMVILPEIFLEKVDRSTMAASVEVRVPFLDIDLVNFCMNLSGPQKMPLGQNKWLLKKALKGIVPDKILYGKKKGFGVPYGYWLRGALKTIFFDSLNSFENAYPNILNYSKIMNLYEEHTSYKRDNSFMLWKILNFTIWAQMNKIKF